MSGIGPSQRQCVSADVGQPQPSQQRCALAALLSTKRHWLCGMLVVLALLFSISAGAQVNDPTPLHFRSAAEEARFDALTHELRCVMCQNQSLAESNAQIAFDLRREVLQLMQSGKSDDQIKAYLVQRYGEFVLYRPKVERNTWLLWFGPAILLVGGALVVLRVVRRRSARPVPSLDDGQEW